MSEKDDKVVSRSEHESLEKTVETLATSMTQYRDDVRAELSEMRLANGKAIAATNDSISELGRSLTSSINTLFKKRDDDISERNREWRERDKIPYPMLALIFSVITAVGGIMAWNMMRIEGDSKTRHFTNVQLIKDEVRELRANDMRFVDKQARNDERVKLLYELRKEDLQKQ